MRYCTNKIDQIPFVTPEPIIQGTIRDVGALTRRPLAYQFDINPQETIINRDQINTLQQAATGTIGIVIELSSGGIFILPCLNDDRDDDYNRLSLNVITDVYGTEALEEMISEPIVIAPTNSNDKGQPWQVASARSDLTPSSSIVFRHDQGAKISGGSLLAGGIMFLTSGSGVAIATICAIAIMSVYVTAAARLGHLHAIKRWARKEPQIHLGGSIQSVSSLPVTALDTTDDTIMVEVQAVQKRATLDIPIPPVVFSDMPIYGLLIAHSELPERIALLPDQRVHVDIDTDTGMVTPISDKYAYTYQPALCRIDTFLDTVIVKVHSVLHLPTRQSRF